MFHLGIFGTKGTMLFKDLALIYRSLLQIVFCGAWACKACEGPQLWASDIEKIVEHDV